MTYIYLTTYLMSLNILTAPLLFAMLPLFSLNSLVQVIIKHFVLYRLLQMRGSTH